MQSVTLRSGMATTLVVGSTASANSSIKIAGVAGDASTVYLGNGKDTVTVGDTHETFVGGSGTDTFSVTAATIGATIDGGSGKSTLAVTGGGLVTMGASITHMQYVTLAAATNFTANNLAMLTVTGSKSADVIHAGSGVDTITGNGGNDVLVAGKGLTIFKDTLANLGHDTLLNFGAADAIEISNDKTPATTTATWANNILTVHTSATAAAIQIAMVGNYTGTFSASLATAKDTIITYAPGAGDTTTPGSGTVLQGTAHNTYFEQAPTATSSPIDIASFLSGNDHIEIDRAIFTGLAGDSAGALSASQFTIGTHATTASQHFVYDNTSGALFYDPNGAGGASYEIALLHGHPTLAASDFILL